MRFARSSFLLIALLMAGTVHAAGPRDALVVDATWLAQHINDPDLVLLHVGDPSKYAARHLPNARAITMQDVSISDHSGQGLMLEMPPADDLRRRLAALGISDTSRVIVYAAQGWVSPTTRVLFTLDYAGLGAPTSVLDGGLDAWVRAGQTVTDVVPAPRQGTLSPLKLRPIVVDAAYVRERLKDPKVSLVDGRASSFYDGVETGGSHDGPHKTGHIAGARSIPFTEIVDERNVLRPAAELKALFAKAGVKEGDTVIGYCHIGQQTTVMLFAARTLGHNVLLYDGSFEDWSRHKDYPVEGAAKKDHR